MSADGFIRLVPYAEDPLQQLAGLLLDRVTAGPPDLSGAIVLFPHGGPASRFRRILLEAAAARGWDALLPPWTGTLTAWLRQFADPTVPALDQIERELLLFGALADFPQLRERCGSWPLVDSLCALFDEFTLNNSRLPGDAGAFRGALAEGYGIEDPELPPLDNEASLAHTLWNAWREQLAADGCNDPAMELVSCLQRSLALPAGTHLFLCGFTEFSRVETDWIRTLAARGQITLLLHGQTGHDGYHPDALLTRLVNDLGAALVPGAAPGDRQEIFDQAYLLTGGDLASRARWLATVQPESPLKEGHHIYHAGDAESEARAVELQVRRWRLEGRRNIGIVTNDRKLARRVRALLERANIPLQDAAGWILSTTSATASLMRWVECIERNFACAPLIDLLRSPFMEWSDTRSEAIRILDVFEKDVILRHNISSGLERYRRALERYGPRLDETHGGGTAGAIASLLDKVETAAKPMSGLARHGSRPASGLIRALMQSLEALGMSGKLGQDEAGQQLLAEIESMAAAVERRPLSLDWKELRAWLQRNLERSRYRPPLAGSGVELMGFEQSRLYRFDGVIIAAATAEHLPGPDDNPPFFNERVRRQLGLPSLRRRAYSQFHDFRRLLQSAPRVLITLQQERDGEPLAASPWVQRLEALHRLAYHETLEDAELERLARSPYTRIAARDATPMPGPRPHPAAPLPAALVPAALSASAHQRLVDCPYQYFAADGLRLAPAEDIREELEKADYGWRVHRILQAFHKGAAGLPGPWKEPLSEDNAVQAQRLLAEISSAVFAGDIDSSFLARGWLYRWQRLIPEYISWQIRREADGWRVADAEIEKSRGDLSQMELAGRIDRVDRRQNDCAVIDYKTGAVPRLDAFLAGEQVQLPSYALLMNEKISQAIILSLGNEKVTDKVTLEGEALGELIDRTRRRLIDTRRAVLGGMPLPAWGDVKTCARCPMDGLCRQEFWSGDEKSLDEHAGDGIAMAPTSDREIE